MNTFRTNLALFSLMLLYPFFQTVAPAQSGVQIDVQPGVNPWTHLNVHNAPGTFQFAIVADRTGRVRPGVFEDAVRKLNLMQPQFVMCVGDLIRGYSEDPVRIDEMWHEFDGIIKPLEMPFFYTPGNHDLTNPVEVEKWKQKFGRTYYHFVYQDVLFLCVNCEEPSAKISPEQIAYFRKVLQQNNKVRWTFLFMHEPLWAPEYKPDTGWPELEAALKDGRHYTVFAGHTHNYVKYIRNDQTYINLSTTGAGRKADPDAENPPLGDMDHVMWVTMTPEGPRMANIEVQGVWDTNVRTEQTKQLTNDLKKQTPVRALPIFCEAEQFNAGTLKLRLTNPGDLPLNISADLGHSHVLQIQPARIKQTLAPRSSQTIDVALSSSEAIPVRLVPQLALNWTATCEPEGQPPIRINGNESIIVQKPLACPAAPRPVTVDGTLDEWGKLPIRCQASADAATASTWKGPEDASYRFAVTHDDSYVYVAVDVTDDRTLLDPKKPTWDQDGIEIRIDARAEPERSLGRGTTEFKDFLVISMSPAAPGGKMILTQPESLPEGVKAVCVQTPRGRVAEVAVPVAYLDGKQGKPWEQIRVNVMVDDLDSADAPGNYLWWQPDWRGKLNYAGSGTFVRQRAR